MPILSGECANEKPIANVGLAPVLPRPGEVRPVPEPSVFSFTPLKALLDTGADGTSITRRVARSHNLEHLGMRPVVGIGGPCHLNTWGTFVCFFFDQDADFEGDNHRATGAYILPDSLLAVEITDNDWFDVIIGRDVLTQFDFSIKRGGRWTLDLR